jgi:hypothetical protein
MTNNQHRQLNATIYYHFLKYRFSSYNRDKIWFNYRFFFRNRENRRDFHDMERCSNYFQIKKSISFANQIRLYNICIETCMKKYLYVSNFCLTFYRNNSFYIFRYCTSFKTLFLVMNEIRYSSHIEFYFPYINLSIICRSFSQFDVVYVRM